MTLRDARTLGVLLVTLALAVSLGPISTGAMVSAHGTISADASTDSMAQKTVDSCTTIEESGTYVLTDDVENAGGTSISESCIEIRADDVTLDGDGHDLGGRGESHTDGVAVVDAENVTLRNFEVHDWHNGIDVENGSVSISDVRSYGNAYGIRLENATDSEVSGNEIVDNLVGIHAVDSEVSLSDNDLTGNELPVKGVNTEMD